MDSYPYNVPVQRNRREYEPFMLNGDAHYSTLEDELRIDRCLFRCQKQRKDSRTGGSRHLPWRLPHLFPGPMDQEKSFVTARMHASGFYFFCPYCTLSFEHPP